MPLKRLPQAIIFDLFGTLVEEFDSAAIKQLMHDCFLRVTADPLFAPIRGVPPEHFADAMKYQYQVRYRAAAQGDARSPQVAHAIADLLVRIAPGVEFPPEAIPRFIEHYGAVERLVPFPETLDVLRTCRNWGLQTALLSNVFFPGAIYERQLAALGFSDWLSPRCFSAEMPYMKPHPEAFRFVADALQLAPEDCLMIGDRVDLDIKGAVTAGMPAVLIGQAIAADFPEVPVIASLGDLLPLLEEAGEYTPAGAE